MLLCVLMGALVALTLALRVRASTSTRLLTWLVATLTAYLAAHARAITGAPHAAWLDWALSLPMLFGPLLYFHVAASTGRWLRFGPGSLVHAAPFAVSVLITGACAPQVASGCQPPGEAWLEHAFPLLLLGYAGAATGRLLRYRARAERVGVLGSVRDRMRRLASTLVAFAVAAILAVPVAWPEELARCGPAWRGDKALGAMLAIVWLWASLWLWPHTLRSMFSREVRRPRSRGGRARAP